MATGAGNPRVLCLDGGGIRGLSEILILKELMLQVQIHNQLGYTPEPKDCFDFICGTNTGGLLAILIGRLGKTLDECETLFRTFGSRIFEGGSLNRTFRLFFHGSRHTSDGLIDVIKRQAGSEEMMYKANSDGDHVPVAVVAVAKTTRHDYLFRTYGVRASTEACSVVDACLATSAATTINGVDYIDGAFGQNNPARAALTELESSEWLAPMQDAVTGVACLVSVGTGRPTFEREKPTFRTKFIPKGALSIKHAVKLCAEIAMDCHSAHLEVKARFKRAGVVDAYHRFDVDRGLESVEPNESNENALQQISAVTKAYLKEHEYEVERCARLLNPRKAPESSKDVTFSSLPERTPTFHGREKKLLKIRESLDPSRPGCMTLLLTGIGGSGKTPSARYRQG